jgi:DNA-directed RNA polymerase subunit M
MEFCKKCKAIMVPVKKGNIAYLKCRKCGYSAKKQVKELKIMEKPKTKKEIITLEKDTIPLPITDKLCPKCENSKAYWWLQQTRSADEPPTQFFRCTKCNHVWREYK